MFTSLSESSAGPACLASLPAHLGLLPEAVLRPCEHLSALWPEPSRELVGGRWLGLCPGAASSLLALPRGPGLRCVFRHPRCPPWTSASLQFSWDRAPPAVPACTRRPAGVWPCPADGGVWMRGGVAGGRSCPGQWSLPLGLSCRGGLPCGAPKVGGSVGCRAPPSCASPALPDCLCLSLSWVHPAGARGTPATEGHNVQPG